ncbi:hypothetical protein VD659_18130 [Herbiconiux sp. 11R-BC]|uniref:hypothetical protein n=1 Tax=Herbiconiux sp. 11R-BC TaxID=3111637 RepID=UPI003C1122B2
MILHTFRRRHLAYNCEKGNASNYRNETSGRLSLSGIRYIAIALDYFDKNVGCVQR